jgi:MFS family permease
MLLGLLSLAGVVLAMQPPLMAPAPPMIGRALDAPTANVAWILTSYLHAAALAAPILGRLGEMFGKCRMPWSCSDCWPPNV